jgi:uncharacterized protein YraI
MYYRKLLLLAAIFAIFWVLPYAMVHGQSVPAFPATGTVLNNANLRDGPGTNFSRAGAAAAGQTVTVAECNSACDWYRLDNGNWIASFLVRLRTDARTPVAAEPTTRQATVNRATAANTANLRSGPGTNFTLVGQAVAGQELDISARNEAGDWYRLDNGAWIAGFLVNGAPRDLPIASVAQPAIVDAQPPAADAVPAPAPDLTGQGNADIEIEWVNFDGGVYRVESDEFAVVVNAGSVPANIGGYTLNAGDPGQDFRFPSFELAPGQKCSVYTNEYHPERCGFSFGRGSAIWNNKGDCGYLYDTSGNEIDRYCY